MPKRVVGVITGFLSSLLGHSARFSARQVLDGRFRWEETGCVYISPPSHVQNNYSIVSHYTSIN